jgi:IS30 family transposase
MILGEDPNSRRPNGSKEIRHRRQCVRAWLMKRDDGMTVRQIAAAIGKTEKTVSAMLKVGERFADEKEAAT